MTLPPAQNVVAPFALITGVAGAALTTTFVAVLVAEQPFVVTVTLYEPAVVTLIDCVVAPFDQSHESPLDAVSVTDPPSQKVVGPPAEIVAAGGWFTVTTFGADVAEQFDPFETCTV